MPAVIFKTQSKKSWMDSATPATSFFMIFLFILSLSGIFSIIIHLLICCQYTG